MKRYPLDLFDRYDVANPSAAVPAALLSPDGRYSCDGCEALTERGALVACQAGYYCAACAPPSAPRFVFDILPHDGGYIIQSPNGGGVVLARRPRGPALLDPVPPRLFPTIDKAASYMEAKGMHRASAPAVAEPADSMRADDVEFVEAIETASGALVVAVFDEEFELLGLFEGFEHHVHIAQDVRALLVAPVEGDTADWPAPCATAQATYDRLTARESAYSVIGRWTRQTGLDLSELRLSRLLGRGPRCILASPLAA